ncbi:MAG: glycosyltransferase [Kiritimatiellia bacterium]|nr:glycosyltransferase [Kiritimatiellia bacterium]
MKSLHQLVAGYTRGDAISNEARVLRALFRRWGYESEIYCERARVPPELRSDIRDAAELSGTIRPEDGALLHLSIGSDVNRIFQGIRARRIVRYHNITPADYFRGIRESTARVLAQGREQAAALAHTADLNLADSRYNALELEAWGYANPRVLPLLLDFTGEHGIRPARSLLRKYRDGLKNVLFVGRCAPNKRIEDVLSAFAVYQRTVEPESRLLLAGSTAGVERYHALLLAQARESGLRQVEWLGCVRQTDLVALYQCAHVFLCMSEHEGFCIPLLEAMFHDVPVAAYAAAAVPETLDGAGVLFYEKRFDWIAETLRTMIEPGPTREAILAEQRRRMERYRARDLETELREAMQGWF